MNYGIYTLNMNKINKIDYFFENNYTNELKNISMFITDNGYELFNKYEIKRINDFFRVNIKHSFTEKTFSNLINAFSYCILDHRNKIIKSQQVEKLDEELKGLNFSILRYRNLLTKSIPLDEKTVYVAKLNESMLKKNKVKKDLHEYIKEVLIWQEAQFNHFKIRSK